MGISLGSFVTLASYRLPRDEDIVFTPSRCTSCGTRLKVPDLVPVLSWLMSGGACRHCKARVHWRYPVIELCTALALLLVFYRYGIGWQAFFLSVFAVGLLVMIVADFEHYMIPDEVHWLLLPLGVVYRATTDGDFTDMAQGFAVGLSLGLFLCYGYSWIRGRQMLGLGDVKFFAVAGIWVGVLTFVPFLFFSGLLGIVTALLWRAQGKPGKFPFGPALAMSLFICVVYPEVPQFFWLKGLLVL